MRNTITFSGETNLYILFLLCTTQSCFAQAAVAHSLFFLSWSDTCRQFPMGLRLRLEQDATMSVCLYDGCITRTCLNQTVSMIL